MDTALIQIAAAGDASLASTPILESTVDPECEGSGRQASCSFARAMTEGADRDSNVAAAAPCIGLPLQLATVTQRPIDGFPGSCPTADLVKVDHLPTGSHAASLNLSSLLLDRFGQPEAHDASSLSASDRADSEAILPPEGLSSVSAAGLEPSSSSTPFVRSLWPSGPEWALPSPQSAAPSLAEEVGETDLESVVSKRAVFDTADDLRTPHGMVTDPETDKGELPALMQSAEWIAAAESGDSSKPSDHAQPASEPGNSADSLWRVPISDLLETSPRKSEKANQPDSPDSAADDTGRMPLGMAVPDRERSPSTDPGQNRLERPVQASAAIAVGLPNIGQAVEHSAPLRHGTEDRIVHVSSAAAESEPSKAGTSGSGMLGTGPAQDALAIGLVGFDADLPFFDRNQGRMHVSAHTATVSAPNVLQLSSQIIARADAVGTGTTTLILSPVELGRVQISFVQDPSASDSLNLSLDFELPQTMELFRRHSDQLTEALRSSGFSEVRIDFGHSSGHGFGQAREGKPEISMPTGDIAAIPDASSMTTTHLWVGPGSLNLRL